MDEETEQTSTEELDSDQTEEQETTEEEGQDTEETEGEEENEEDDGLDEAEYEGKKYRVPKEIAPLLLKADSMQADYTRKTTEAAEMRKQAEAVQQQSQEAIRLVSQFQKEYGQLQAIDSQLEELKGIDWNQAVEIDSTAAMKLQFKYNQLLQQRGELAGNINNLQDEVEQKRNQALQEQIQQGAEVCKREIPGFGTPEVTKKIVDTGKWIGFTEQDLSGITDPRAIKALYLLSGIKESQEKLKAKPKAVEVKPTQSIKGGKSAPKPGLSDELSSEEWLRRRNAEVLKAKGR